MSDASDSREMLAAAPLGSWGADSTRYPLAVLPCMGLRYDRNGFPSYPGRSEDE
ncbi:MAG TPA: hypothetical protein VMC82_03150 [Thermoplasmata archaeon]|nr:hypothetical protein [Thermoplasmata archaeon]